MLLSLTGLVWGSGGVGNYYSGFQCNMAQLNAFQILPFAQEYPVTEVTKGGFDERAYKKYRKYLKELVAVTEQRNESLYKKKVVGLSEKLSSAPENITEKLADAVIPTLSLDTIDYQAISFKLQAIIALIDQEIYKAMLKRQEEQEDEEAAFLLLIA